MINLRFFKSNKPPSSEKNRSSLSKIAISMLGAPVTIGPILIGLNFTEKDVEVTRAQLLKADTRNFENLSAKLNMLHEIRRL
jgi:hypothetical protein